MTTNDVAFRHEHADFSTQRLRRRYRFADPNMDLFFLGALGWGAAGGLSTGEAFHVADGIVDGDPASWTEAFERQGDALAAAAASWRQVGAVRAAGESELKAFACYRSAWQFAPPGGPFERLHRSSGRRFDQAMVDLRVDATRFEVPYGGGLLPGRFFRPSAPSGRTILVLGGADTSHEDRFLSQGRHYLDRGYSVALVDLPGQGVVQAQGLHWEPRAELPIAAVVDLLVGRFGVEPGRLALLGMSLGGYFACRAAARALPFAAVAATPALYRPIELFEASMRADAVAPPSRAAAVNRRVLMWKAGASDPAELMERWRDVRADPRDVTIPFLSVLGLQEGELWRRQTREWHDGLPSRGKRLVELGAETGADAHCQGGNPLRLVQEVDAWLSETLGTSGMEEGPRRVVARPFSLAEAGRG